MSEETTTTEPSHNNTDDATVESGNLLADDNTSVDETEDAGNVAAAETTDETTTDDGDHQEAPPFELPEEYRDNPRFAGIDSVEALYKRINETGAPEDYTFPEGFDENLAGIIGEYAKDADIPQQNLDAFLKFTADQQQATRDATLAEINSGVDGLKAEWGEEFDNNVKDARRAIAAFDDADGSLAKLIKGRPEIGSNPTVLKFLKAIHAAIDVDKFLDSDGKPRGGRPVDKDGMPYLSSYDKSMR